MGFDINKIQKYFQAMAKKDIKKFNKNNPDNKTKESFKERGKYDFEKMENKNFNIRSIFSLFDKNKDGKITQKEFAKVSEIEYTSFIEGLKEYNNQNNRSSSNDSIWSYAQMEGYVNDHVSPGVITEDEVLFDDLENFYMEKVQEGSEKNDTENKTKNTKEYIGTHGFEETFNLKDISQMSDEEILSELTLYKVVSKNKNRIDLVATLADARRERAKHDIGSDKVDGHIGTFVQNKTGVCTVLAHIGTMSDEEIRQLYIFDEGHDFGNPMIDENGKQYWKIKFPIDKDDKIVIITQDEIESGKIETEKSGKKVIVKEFPEGDKDITLLSMAFIKRFGVDIVQSGEWSYITRNRFKKPEDIKYKDNQYLEMITDYKILERGVINCLNLEEIQRKGFKVKQLKNEDLSWIPDKSNRVIAQLSEGLVYELSSGLKACISKYGIFLSDGRKIEPLHTMEIRKYDKKTNELLISGNEFNNMSEIRIPIELLQFFETASHPGTPGVNETPDPNLKDTKI